MFGTDASGIYKIIYALLTLAVSVFALTSLDSGTRLSRYMFSELFLKEGEASYKDAKGIRKVLAYPLTVINSSNVMLLSAWPFLVTSISATMRS